MLRIRHLNVLAITMFPVIFLSYATAGISAQNETNDTEVFSSTNETASASMNNTSTPILFEVNSQSKDNKALNQSLFKAQVAWTPNAIGSENTFDIKFLNSSSGEELRNIKYDIMLFDKGNHLSESHRSDQQATSQKYVFPEQGFYTLKIDNIGNTTASIDLPIQVVPEFGAGSAAVFIAGTLGFMLLIVRYLTRSPRLSSV